MRAISSMATRQVLGALADDAVAAGLPRVEIESIGGVDAEARVAAGEAVDLVFLASGALGRLAAAGFVDAETVTPLVLSQTAVAVASGSADPANAPVEASAGISEGALASAPAPTWAFRDAAGLRDALRAAGRIGYSTGPSGTALVTLVADWGMTAELGERLVQARPGIPVARSLADGDVDLGFQQLSELVGQPGVRILGVLPPDCAIDTVFGGAVATASADPAAAAAVLARFAVAAASGVAGEYSFSVPA